MKTILSILIVPLFLLSACNDKKGTSKNTSTIAEKRDSIKVDSKKSVKNNGNNSSEGDTFHYICYTSDGNKTDRIWIRFTGDDKAEEIKYEGQKESIHLEFEKEEYIAGGAHPTIITYYKEMYNGKVNGKYILKHSGVWDYVTYIRGKDNKEFSFTIDHNSENYSTTPCFE